MGWPRGMAVVAVSAAVTVPHVLHVVMFQLALAWSGSMRGAGHQWCPARGHAAVVCTLSRAAIRSPV
eukprot:6555072-Heterocapsa_arctica.AAC.1